MKTAKNQGQGPPLAGRWEGGEEGSWPWIYIPPPKDGKVTCHHYNWEKEGTLQINPSPGVGGVGGVSRLPGNIPEHALLQEP